MCKHRFTFVPGRVGLVACVLCSAQVSILHNDERHEEDRALRVVASPFRHDPHEHGERFEAGSPTVSYTVSAATTSATYELNAEPGSYTVTGYDAALIVGRAT